MSAPSASDETAPGRGSPSSRARRPGSARRRRGSSRRKGWQCVLVARREDRLRALAEELGGEVELCDVADRDAVEAMAARILERHPAIHLLVNNAGMPGSRLLPHGRPRPRAPRDRGQLPRRRLVHARAAAGPPRGAPPGSARRQPRLGRRNDRLRAGRGIRGVEARPARLLPLALVGAPRLAASPSTPCCPGFVETEGFPQKNVLKSRLMGRFVIQPPQVAEAVLRSIEKGKGEITVPWFPYRPISIVQALSPGLVARFAGMSDYRPGSV